MVAPEIVAAVSSDDAYVLGAITTLFSVVESATPGAKVSLVLLDCGLSAASRARVRSAAGGWGAAATLRLETVHQAPLASLPMHRHFSAATYARLVLAELCPDLSRVMYLDSDVLVRGPLEAAVASPLRPDQVCGAVVDASFPTLAEGLLEGAWSDGRPPQAPYYNAGVLLMALDRWRDEHIGERVSTYLASDGQRNRFVDQDGLNAVIGARFHTLHRSFNHQLGREVEETRARVSSHAKAARVIHFIGAKPWQAHGVFADATRLWAVRRWYESLMASGALTSRESRGLAARMAGGQVRRIAGRLTGRRVG